jgi:hypothetical protein
MSKFRETPDEIKVLANLHIPVPAIIEILVGVCEAIGVVALVFVIYARLASVTPYTPMSYDARRLLSGSDGPFTIYRYRSPSSGMHVEPE